jgi:hypothetical protein
MLQGTTRQTGRAVLLIRKVQVRVLPGRKPAGQRVERVAVLALWQSLVPTGLGCLEGHRVGPSPAPRPRGPSLAGALARRAAGQELAEQLRSLLSA